MTQEQTELYEAVKTTANEWLHDLRLGESEAIADYEIGGKTGYLKIHVLDYFNNVLEAYESPELDDFLQQIPPDAVCGAFHNYLGGGMIGRICPAFPDIISCRPVPEPVKAAIKAFRETIPAVYFNMELEAHEDYFTEEEMASTDWDKALARRQSMPVSGY